MTAVYTNYRVLLFLQVDKIYIPVHAAHDRYVSMYIHMKTDNWPCISIPEMAMKDHSNYHVPTIGTTLKCGT